MGKSIKNPRQQERDWQDLINEKKAYLKRKQEEEESESLLSRNQLAWDALPDEEPPF